MENNQEKLVAEIAPVEEKVVNKPTEEEIEKFKQIYEDMAEKFQATKYRLGDETNGAKFLDTLLHYVEFNASWAGSMWLGMPKLFEELTEIKKSNATVISISYQALMYTHHILSNPSGVGLASALEIEKIAQELTDILNIITKLADDANKTLKDIQKAYDTYVASLQGFYLEDLVDNLEEKTADDACQSCSCDGKNGRDCDKADCECGDNCKCKE
jgi:hypothetical protein